MIVRTYSRQRSASALLVFLLAAPAGIAQDDKPIIEPGGRVRTNSWLRMAVPPHDGEQPVMIEIFDPWGQSVWFGASRGDTFTVYTRDWADGEYTIRFTPGGQRKVHIDTRYFDSLRARGGKLLQLADPQRLEYGFLRDKNLSNMTNLLQRWLLYEIYMEPPATMETRIASVEKAYGLHSTVGIMRLLGSGAADHQGYDGPYRPLWRERNSVFMPPDTVIDFAANAERKLARWGYGVKDVAQVFISHSHADHFDADAVIRFAKKRKAAGLEPLRFYAGKASCDMLAAKLGESSGDDSLVVIKTLKPGDEVHAGDLVVKAVRAHHDPKASPLCYILRWHNATAYYGTDTGFPPDKTVEALKQERFDAFCHEVTFGVAGDGEIHSDMEDLRRLVGTLRRVGAITSFTRVVNMHQCKLSLQVVPDLSYFEEMIGFESGFDGMPIPIVYTEPIARSANP